jgi:predicted secreted protein
MKALTVTLAAAASALMMTAASAAPISVGTSSAASVARDGNIQNVRMVCNEEGRCWREHSERRVIIRDRDAYDYAPRERYIDRRDRGYEDRGGIGFRAPGVSVGIGTDRY